MVASCAELRRIWELLTLGPDAARRRGQQVPAPERGPAPAREHRALAVEPKLIVADEAVSMVDVSIRVSLLKMLTA